MLIKKSSAVDQDLELLSGGRKPVPNVISLPRALPNEQALHCTTFSNDSHTGQCKAPDAAEEVNSVQWKYNGCPCCKVFNLLLVELILYDQVHQKLIKY